MLSCTSEVPPSIEFAFERSHWRVMSSSRASKPSPSQPSDCCAHHSSMSSNFRLFCSLP